MITNPEQNNPSTVWHAGSPAGPARSPLATDITVDLAVIGGGFTGLSTALHAAKSGVDVVVLEAHRVAWGATGRNAGFVVPNFAKMDPDAVIAHLGDERGKRLNDFAATSADVVFDLIARHDIDCDGLQNGWIQPAHCDAALERVKSRARQWQAQGRPAEILDGPQVTELTGAKGYKGGWIDWSGGVINPVKFAIGLAKAAETAGALIFEQSPVLAMTASQGGWELDTPNGRVQAKRVIMATNAYGENLNDDLRRSYFPLKVFQIATKPLPQSVRTRLLPGGQCVSDTRRNLFTFRFDADNRLITGGMHIFGPGAAARVPSAIHRRLADMLEMDDLPQIEFSWSGIASVMPDFLPRLVELGPNLVAAFACNGRGIAMTTQMGKSLAQWASGTGLDALAIPVTRARPLPLHRFLKHAPNILLPVSMLRDRMETAQS